MLRIGPVQLENPLLLAPIAGYCDLAFRLVVRKLRGPSGGVGLACTDLLCPQAMLSESTKTLWLAATCPEDQPVCMQIYGARGFMEGFDDLEVTFRDHIISEIYEGTNDVQRLIIGRELYKLGELPL